MQKLKTSMDLLAGKLSSRLACLIAALVAVAICALAPAGSSHAASAENPADAALTQRLDTVLDKAVSEGRIVGAVLMVARQGQVVYARAVGMADVEKAVPMNMDTRFRLASMSKPITSAAALALADKGMITLDDPVTRWIPSFTPVLEGNVDTVVTVRHLLTHTAGLSYGFSEPPDGPMARAEVSDGLDDPPITLEENIWRLASVPLYYEPGTDWKYSLAIDVLGEIVSRAGGDKLPNVVQRLVTGPLGMTHTGFVADDPDQLAAPYVWANGKTHRMAETELVPNAVSATRFQPRRALDGQAFPSGGAGMVGTAADYLKFIEAVRENGGLILKPETAKAMTADQVCPILSQRLSVTAGKSNEVVAPGWGFGFGGAVLLRPEKAAYPAGQNTWSWSGAYGSHFFMDRANGISFVALTNTTPTGMAGPFAVDLANAVYGKP